MNQYSSTRPATSLGGCVLFSLGSMCMQQTSCQGTHNGPMNVPQQELTERGVKIRKDKQSYAMRDWKGPKAVACMTRGQVGHKVRVLSQMHDHMVTPGQEHILSGQCKFI